MTIPPCRVLVLDDEANVRVTLAANLELAGFEVADAASVDEAAALLRGQRFDMLVSDVRMPGKDGLSGMDELRAVQPDLPVVFVTGYDAEDVIPEALGKGAYTVLSKPVPIERLISVILEGMTSPAVLVVDDEEPFLEALVEGLRAAGLRVERAVDRESSIEIIQRRAVDVCVLDLVLRGTDGLEVLSDLRARDPVISVIAMTSHDVGDLIRDIMRGGAYHCLRKPFEVHVLTRLIGRARSERPAPPDVWDRGQQGR